MGLAVATETSGIKCKPRCRDRSKAGEAYRRKMRLPWRLLAGLQIIVWLFRSRRPAPADPDCLQNGDREESRSMITYLFKIRKRADHVRVTQTYRSFFPLCMFSDPLHWCALVFLGKRRFRHKDQRPEKLYVPHLTAKPWHEHDATAAALEANFETIKEEYLRVAQEAKQHPE